ncbi:MAG: hypothetical protein ACI4I5_06300 [Acutalibacteraceae bacterium]
MVEENNRSENLNASDAPATEAAAEIPAQASAQQKNMIQVSIITTLPIS